MCKILDPIDPKGHHGVREAGIIACDNHVANPDQHQPACDHFTLHFCNDWLGDIPPAPTHSKINFRFDGPGSFRAGQIKATPGSDCFKLRQLGAVAQIMPRRKMLAVSRQDDHIDLVILRGQIKSGIEFVRHFSVLSIARLISRNDDPRNTVFHRLVPDGFKRLTHSYPLFMKTKGPAPAAADKQDPLNPTLVSDL